FAKDHDGGRYQCIRELHIGGAKAVNVQERNAFGEIPAQRYSVIHVHEFGGDKPNGEGSVFHPVVAQEHEITIEPGKAADIDVQRLRELEPEPILLRSS